MSATSDQNAMSSENTPQENTGFRFTTVELTGPATLVSTDPASDSASAVAAGLEIGVPTGFGTAGPGTVGPAAVETPAFLNAGTEPPHIPSSVHTHAPLSRAGAALVKKISETVVKRLAVRIPSVPAPDADGQYELKSRAKIQTLPRLSGQDENTSYCLVAKGLPLPPGGVAYLVSYEAREPLVQTASAHARLKDLLTTTRAVKVSVHALIDEFGRAFCVADPVLMPPACLPEIQFKRYPGDMGRGCVDVLVGRGKTVRAAEYLETPRGLSLINARCDLGSEASSLSLCAACAIAFLALWLFPHRSGYSVETVGVKDVVARLRTADLFEALQAVTQAADQVSARPLVVVPGFLSYLAQTIRQAGLDHLSAGDLSYRVDEVLSDEDFRDAHFFDISQAASTSSESAPPVPPVLIQGLADMLHALESGDVTGLSVIGVPGTLQEITLHNSAPDVRLLRTTRYANSFYVAFDRGELSDESCARLLEAESILNRLLLASETDLMGALQGVGERDAAQLDRWVIDQCGKLAWAYMDGKIKRADAAGRDSDELDERIAFARGCECLRLPYRLEYSFRYDAATGEFLVDAECPPADIMPRIDYDAEVSGWVELSREVRDGLASRYAAFTVTNLAAVAFWASPQIRRVTVNARHYLPDARERAEDMFVSYDNPVCVLSATFERAHFIAHLSTPFARAAFIRDPFMYLGSIEHAFVLDSSQRLLTVSPLQTARDDMYHREDPSTPPEDDRRPLPAAATEMLHAQLISDLSIFEGAQRKEKAQTIIGAFEKEGHLAALARARTVSESTEDPLLKEALMRVSKDIATDAITVENCDEIESILDDVYGMQEQMALASSTVKSDPKRARLILEDILLRAEANSWFSDSATRLYRYFDSYASRAVYALRCGRDCAGRELCLCTDEYFMAHYRLSMLLSDSFENGEEAIQHAKRCVELAPSVATAHLRLARSYFSVFDYASEIEAIKDAVTIIWNPKDLGIALYWLGYALCMTDRLDAGMACYRRCVLYDRSLAESAASEMADIMHKRGCEPKIFTEQEALAHIRSAGVDIDAFRQNVDFIMKTAASIVEVGNYGLACSLISAASLSLHDDALAPVLDSLQ